MSTTSALTDQTQSTDFWQWTGWSVQVKSDQQHRTLRPRRPFALVGSHHCCHLRVSSRSVPDIAYLLCCIENRIEAWPLANRNGRNAVVISPDESLSVGPCELGFHLDPPQASPEEERVKFNISIEVWSDEEVLERHLSTGVHLLSSNAHDLKPTDQSAATHAAINQNGSLWIVDLSARKMRRSERVRRLSLFENEYVLGRSILAVTDIAPVEINAGKQIDSLSLHDQPLAASDTKLLQDQLLSDSKELLFDSNACLEPQMNVAEINEAISLNSDNDPRVKPLERIAEPLIQRVSGVISMLSEFTAREANGHPQAKEENQECKANDVKTGRTAPSQPKIGLLDQIQPTENISPIHVPRQFAPIDRVAKSQASGGNGMNKNSCNSEQNGWQRHIDNGSQLNPTVEKDLPQDQWFTSFAVGEGLSETPLSDLQIFTSLHNPNNQLNSPEESPQLVDSDNSHAARQDLEIPCDKTGSDSISEAVFGVFQGQERLGNCEPNDSDGTGHKNEVMHHTTPSSPTSIDTSADATAFARVNHSVQRRDANDEEAETNPTLDLEVDSDRSASANPSNEDSSTNDEEAKAMQGSTDYTDMSSFSFVPSDEESRDQLANSQTNSVDQATNPVEPPPVEQNPAEKLVSENSDLTPMDQQDRPTPYRHKVRSLSDYKIDPDELTTEISVRLAKHVAPKRGFLATVRKLFVVTTIIAVHVAVFYFVGQRVYELISAAP